MNNFYKSTKVNLIGYLRSEHGVGEAARQTAACLIQNDVSWQGYDFEIGNPSRTEDHTLDSYINQKVDAPISIININADQLPVALEKLPESIHKTYKIGVWYWELPVFPDEWKESFRMVDEIWAPTRFIYEALKEKALCPVYYMPPGLTMINVGNEYARKNFKLPSEAFLFLSMYDVNSYTDRKNADAPIIAFQKVFSPNDMSVGLVVKINNGKEDVGERIKKLIGEYKNIYVFNEIWTKDKVNGLLECCDVAVSLHRSEGLGLLCMEAMCLGKPVIATGWSGNMDFMDDENACLVDYKMIDVESYAGIDTTGNKWAEPNIATAAVFMKKLKDDKRFYSKKALIGKEKIVSQFNAKVCGRRMLERIENILQNYAKYSSLKDNIDLLRATGEIGPMFPNQNLDNIGFYLNNLIIQQRIFNRLCADLIEILAKNDIER